MFKKIDESGWLLIAAALLLVKALWLPDTIFVRILVIALVAGCGIGALVVINTKNKSGEGNMKRGAITFAGDSGSQISINIAGPEAAKHLLVLGTTRRGRSSLIEADAARRGLSYDEAEKDWMPTEAERLSEVEREKAAQAKKDARTAAVRDAYWAATTLAEGEFASLYDVLATECERVPTDDHVRRLYNMLPAEVIGEGVKWGFTDTVVGDSIFVFVRENKADVMAQVFSE